MNVLELLKNATQSPEPVIDGQWATVAFRPDLGSQQEFIVGVAAAIRNDHRPHIKWVPSLQKLSSLYGNALTSTEVTELMQGTEQAIRSSFKGALATQDTGTPHMRIASCGYIATHDIDKELSTLLKRHAGAIWAETVQREESTGDDWAYTLMRKAISASKSKIFVPNRRLEIESKTLNVALDNGISYGNIVSARFANPVTIEKHVNGGLLQILAAHKMTARRAPPALFVVLPEPETSVQQMLARKTKELLGQIEDIGVSSFSNSSSEELAADMERWAL